MERLSSKTHAEKLLSLDMFANFRRFWELCGGPPDRRLESQITVLL